MRELLPDRGPFWVHDLFWLLIVVALVAGAILLARLLLDRPRSLGGRWGAPPWQHQNPALHELDLRYARGELDRTEYLQRRADLLGQPGPEPRPPA
jgi:putative membrane protein